MLHSDLTVARRNGYRFTMTSRPTSVMIDGALTFLLATAVVWGGRHALTRDYSKPPDSPIRLSARVPASVRQPPSSAVAAPPLSAPLSSVSMGLLHWPETGDPAAVNAAFADAWRKLRPSLPATDEEDKARQLFADWWKTDPEAALRFVSDPPGLFVERGGMFLLPLLAAQDPARAWALTNHAGDLSARTTAQTSLLNTWAMRAPDEAMAFAAGLPAHQKLQAEAAVLAGWPGERAFAWCAALPESWHKQKLLNGLLHTAAANDPAAVAAAMQSGGVTAKMVNGLDAVAVDRIMRAAFATERDPLAVCLRAEKADHAMLAVSAWRALLEVRGTATPGTVAILAAAFPDKASDAFMDALGRAAPEAGLAWALQNKVPPGRLLTEWARGSPDAAMAALRALPDNEQTRDARLAVAQDFSAANPEVAAAALENYPANAASGSLLRSAARGMARLDPVRALQLLNEAPDTTPEEVSVILAIGGRSNPQATSEALAKSDLPVTDTVASESFIRGWGASDPVAASEWVHDLPPGDLRDGGAAGLARIITESDPVSAFAWALEVVEPDMRARVLGSVFDEAVRRGLSTESMMNDPRLAPVERGTLRARNSSSNAP